MSKNLRSSIKGALNRSIKPGLLSPAQFRGSTLDLDFAGAKSLQNQIGKKDVVSFTRASSGTYVDGDGLIKTSPVNLVYPSESIDAGVGLWSTTAVNGTIAVTPNYEQSPYGANTATRVEATKSGTTSNEFGILQVQPSISGTSVGSIWIKSNTGSNQTIYFRVDLGGSEDYNLTVTPEWQRYEMVEDEGSGTCFFSVGLRGGSDNSCDISIWGAQLEEGTTATDYIPTTTTISGAPRFDHDPVTGESLGLLIEEARTNLLTYSGSIRTGNDGFFTNATTVTTNADTAPDGTTTATRLSSDVGFAYVTASLTSGVDYVFSFYAKTSTDTSWTVNTQGSPFIDKTVTVVPGEWTRVDLAFTATATGSQQLRFIKGGGLTGDILIWGAQVEAGSFPTSYIPTSGSTVTRAADVAEISGTNFSSWYNQSEGTVFAESRINRVCDTATTSIVFVDDGTESNFLGLFYRPNGATGASIKANNIATLGSSPYGVVSANTTIQQAIAYKAGDSVGAGGGNLTAVSLAASTPNVNRLLIGDFVGTGARLDGHIKRLAYFNTRLPDTNLQNITT